MDKELRYIHPKDIRAYWPMLRDGLQQVCDHSTSGWIIEDAYQAVLSGNSTLHIGFIDGQYIGFVILTPFQGWNKDRLHVWCAYANTEHDPVELFIDDLRTMAKNIGAKQLTFSSPRGWERRLKQYGWVPVKQTFAMEVQQ